MGFIGNDGSELAGGLNPSSVVKGLKVDAAGNLLVNPSGTGAFEVTGLSAGSLNADLVPSTDVSAYRWFALQVTGVWSASLSFLGSNDGISFYSVPVYSVNSGATVSTTVNGLFWGVCSFRYLRVRMTAYTSGTANGINELYSVAPPYMPTAMNSFITGGSLSLMPATSGGVSDFHLISAATNNATNIKASAGQVYGYDISNTNAAWRYVKLYNKATAPAPAADTGLLIRTIGIPPGGKASLHLENGLAGFAAGIAIVAVVGIADNDNTSVGASDLSIDIDWK